MNANLSVAFAMAAVEYTEPDVPINVDGAPVVMAATFRTKPATGDRGHLDDITKNAVASC